MAIILDKSTPGGTPYTEDGGSPEFDFKQLEVTATSKWLMHWADMVSLVNEVFNYAFVATVGAAPLPMQMPGAPGLYCDSIKFSPFDPEQPGGIGSSAIARATLGWKTMNLLDDKFTWTMTIGGEYVGVPSILACWNGITPVATTSDEGVTFGKLIPTIEHNLNWSRVIVIPWDAIRACIGCVNSVPFTSLNGQPAETVLFVGATITGTVSFQSRVTQYSIDFKFSEKPTNWNFFLQPSSGTFQRIQYVPPGSPKDGSHGLNVYSARDLNALLVGS